MQGQMQLGPAADQVPSLPTEPVSCWCLSHAGLCLILSHPEQQVECVQQAAQTPHRVLLSHVQTAARLT